MACRKNNDLVLDRRPQKSKRWLKTYQKAAFYGGDDEPKLDQQDISGVVTSGF